MFAIDAMSVVRLAILLPPDNTLLTMLYNSYTCVNLTVLDGAGVTKDQNWINYRAIHTRSDVWKWHF